MRERDLVMGGEQSGHIVFSDYATTGDGLLTGLLLSDLVRRARPPLSVLAAQMTRYPQVMVNVRVPRRVDLASTPSIAAAVARGRSASSAIGGACSCGRREPSRSSASWSRPSRRRWRTAPSQRLRSVVEAEFAPSLTPLAIHAMCGIVAVVCVVPVRVSSPISPRSAPRSTGARPRSARSTFRREPALDTIAIDLARRRRRAARARDGIARAGRRSGCARRARAARRTLRGTARRDRGAPRRERARQRRRSRRSTAALVACKDALWAIKHDRLGAARAVEELLGGGGAPSVPAAAFHSIQVALSALDRLEVRGRDSAGLHVLVTGHGLDLDRSHGRRHARGAYGRPAVRRRVRCARRTAISAFVYKTAAEIGELGDNTARLRAQIRDDELLRLGAAFRDRGSRGARRTRAGRASASSRRRTRIRSTRKRSTAPQRGRSSSPR